MHDVMHFRFDLINHTEPLDDEAFDRNADSIDIDWGEYTEASHSPFLTTTYPPHNDNQTETSHVEKHSDIYITDGFGIHFLGRSFGVKTVVWYLLVWVRTNKDVYQKWVMLDFDPSKGMHDYELEVERDMNTKDTLWNIRIVVDGEFRSEMRMELPETFTIKIKIWNYGDHINEITDPFTPFQTECIIEEVMVPLPQVQHISVLASKMKRMTIILVHKF